MPHRLNAYVNRHRGIEAQRHKGKYVYENSPRSEEEDVCPIN
jgi:hypothetical protein